MGKYGLLVLLSALAFATSALYEGHRVLRVTPSTNVQVKALLALQSDHVRWQVDFWVAPTVPFRSCDIRVPPSRFHLLTQRLKNFALEYTILIEDVQQIIDSQRRDDIDSGLHFDYAVYHTLDEINAWVKSATSTSTLASGFVPATSFENRQLQGLKISAPNSTAGKPAIWIEGGIHAREWISPATVIYMTNKFLSGYGTDPDITDLINTFDWYVLPVTNPDGYAFTWEKDRLWRKTRSKHFPCIGVDPNRNWDYHWCEQGASRDPCSETYCGPSAFSESEIKGVAEFIEARKASFKGFIDFHSYSQLWMTPWGYTTELPKDFTVEDKSSVAAVNALKAVHGTDFEHGEIATTIYIASGSSADWAHGVAGTAFPAAVELRDKGQFGFLLPADQIIPSGEETLQALIAFGKFVQNNM